VVKLAVLDAGTGLPSITASAVIVYGVLGFKPSMGHTVVVQFLVTHAPPLVGQAVTV